MFDDQSKVRWARLPISDLDSPAHHALALRAARESIVLLKNARNTLPLSKSLKTVAVIGPNADQWRMLLGNYNGIPSDPITPLRGIREALPNARVVYAVGSDLADGFPVLDVVPAKVLSSRDGKPGLTGEYFTSHKIEGAPLFTRIDSTLDVNWKEGAPRADMNPDDFAVRWTGTLRPPTTGTYRLGLIGTVKFRLYLDDSLITQSLYPSHDGEFPDPRLAQAAPLTLQGGRSYRIRVEAEETYGLADLQFLWSAPHEALEAEALDAGRRADAVILTLGLTARLEGEEMSVQIDGFRGGDRTSLDLPAAQERLMERVVALGKPTVLVLMSGSAVAVNWAQEHVPAIIEAWYPGQASGTAIADVLFGNYSPAGRLPVTFYRSVNDLPPFDHYKMAGRTYRFFNGQPLYPFGFGLSYTTFSYKNLRTSAETMAKDGSVTASVDVTNTGTRAGDEVVQLYVKHDGSAVERPKQDLRGYSRLSLAPGETKTVTMKVDARSLAYWNAQRHEWVIESEPIRLRVGASSADIRLEKTIRVQ